MKKIILILSFAISLFAIELHKEAKNIILEGMNGGLAKDGSSWNFNSLKGRVSVLLYIDPDEKEVNKKFSQLIEKQKFNKDSFVKVAVINLAATWKPDFVIEKILVTQQADFPQNIYLKDKKSVFVKQWELTDNASNVLIFSKDLKLLYQTDKAMNKEERQKALKIINEALVK